MAFEQMLITEMEKYRQITNISRTKSQNVDISCLVLQLSLCNLLKPCVKSSYWLHLGNYPNLVKMINFPFQRRIALICIPPD